MAYSGTDIGPLNPGEARNFSLTFTLTGGETISSVAWGIACLGNLDMAAASKLGAGSLSGAIASNTISNLIPGCKYVIQALATTSLGNIYDLFTHCLCQSPN